MGPNMLDEMLPPLIVSDGSRIHNLDSSFFSIQGQIESKFCLEGVIIIL